MIASAELMVVLDNTIVNIALPSIQTDLGIPAGSLAWIVNAYALAFGGLLLLGGKSGDLFGRRRMFRIGVTLFVAASVLGGAVNSEQWLIAARALQGIGGSIAAPTALSLIAVNFEQGKPRNRAMGLYGAMAGLGATLGLLLGGVLTEYLDWRWVFFVNIPIGLAVLAGTRVLVEGERNQGRLDLVSAVLGTSGLLALVYAIMRGGESGWTDRLAVGSACAALALLILFIWRQARSADPMMPLRLFAARSRAGSYGTMLFIGAGMFATFYFLTLYMQQVQGFSPVKTGLAYLPFSIGMGAAAGISSKLSATVAPRLIAGPGLLIAACGMLWLSTLKADSSYLTHLMPGMILTAFGLGLCFVPMTLGAVANVKDQDTGIAAALLNTSQQVGGALGLAVLTTIATTAANNQLPDATASLYRGFAMRDGNLIQAAGSALTHGYTTAFLVSAVFFLCGLIVTALAIIAPAQQSATAAAVHV